MHETYAMRSLRERIAVLRAALIVECQPAGNALFALMLQDALDDARSEYAAMRFRSADMFDVIYQEGD